jgi:hypothetical protein
VPKKAISQKYRFISKSKAAKIRDFGRCTCSSFWVARRKLKVGRPEVEIGNWKN